MLPPDRPCFGYQIRLTSDGWSWVTYDLEGAVKHEGRAPEKALAAAMVVRALARAAAEEVAKAGS